MSDSILESVTTKVNYAFGLTLEGRPRQAKRGEFSDPDIFWHGKHIVTVQISGEDFTLTMPEQLHARPLAIDNWRQELIALFVSREEAKP